MQVREIIRRVNIKLAGELLEGHELVPYLDDVIDDINSRLNSCYPAFSEFTLEAFPHVFPDYCFFPDEYVRKVVIVGCAYKFYVTDEEGAQASPEYAFNYNQNIFEMQRDWLDLVPPCFKKSHALSAIGVPAASVKLHENGYGRGNGLWQGPTPVDFGDL